MSMNAGCTLIKLKFTETMEAAALLTVLPWAMLHLTNFTPVMHGRQSVLKPNNGRYRNDWNHILCSC